MKKSVKGTLTVASFGLFTAFAAVSHSDTLPAMAGHAWVAADDGCFNSSHSRMTNSCGSTKKLLIPIQSRANGSVTFKASPASVSAGLCVDPVACRAVVTSNINGFIAQTPQRDICPTAGNNLVTLGSITVGSAQVAHYDCDFPSGSTLGSVTF